MACKKKFIRVAEWVGEAQLAKVGLNHLEKKRSIQLVKVPSPAPVEK